MKGYTVDRKNMLNSREARALILKPDGKPIGKTRLFDLVETGRIKSYQIRKQTEHFFDETEIRIFAAIPRKVGNPALRKRKHDNERAE